eukprot:1396807-Ditylum_brightwellii.AAC.1
MNQGHAVINRKPFRSPSLHAVELERKVLFNEIKAEAAHHVTTKRPRTNSRVDHIMTLVLYLLTYRVEMMHATSSAGIGTKLQYDLGD